MNELACFEQDAVSLALKHPEYSSYFTLFCPSSAFHVCLCMRVCVGYLAFLAVWHMKSFPMSLFNGYCSFRLQVYKHMQTFIRSRAYMYLQGSVNISWTVCTRACVRIFSLRCYQYCGYSFHFQPSKSLRFKSLVALLRKSLQTLSGR